VKNTSPGVNGIQNAGGGTEMEEISRFSTADYAGNDTRIYTAVYELISLVNSH